MDEYRLTIDNTNIYFMANSAYIDATIDEEYSVEILLGGTGLAIELEDDAMLYIKTSERKTGWELIDSTQEALANRLQPEVDDERIR